MRIPDKDTITDYLRYYSLLSVAFLVVYGATNYWAGHRSDRYEIYCEFEQGIPFIPEAIVVYLSVGMLFLLPLLYIDKPRISALAKAFLFTLVIGGISFVVFPANPAHGRVDEVSFLPGLFKLFYSLELPHNLMPSLHIAYTVLFLTVCGVLETRRIIVVLYCAWGFLLFGSVLVLHQHQLIDVFTGALLGWVAYRWVYKKSVG